MSTGGLFLTGPSSSSTTFIPVTNVRTSQVRASTTPNLGIGLSGDDNTGITTATIAPTIGSTTVIRPTPRIPPLARIYWNHLDTDWAENTQTTVAVFTTPSASVGGRSLNPLSEVDEETFVTADGAEYLEQSGIREAAGLGSNLSWTVPPAEVASRSVTFLGNEVTMRSYVGYVTTGDSEIPRTLLINLATTETGDDIAFGVTVQHRAMYSLGEASATVPIDAILSAMSVPDLVGTEATSGLADPYGPSSSSDTTLIVEAGVTASADLAAQALGDLSLA